MESLQDAYMGVIGQSMQDNIGKITQELVFQPYVDRNGKRLQNGTVYRMKFSQRLFMLQYFTTNGGDVIAYQYVEYPWCGDIGILYVGRQDMAQVQVLDVTQVEAEGFLPWRLFHSKIQERFLSVQQEGMPKAVITDTYQFNATGGGLLGKPKVHRTFGHPVSLSPFRMQLSVQVNMTGDGNVFLVCVVVPDRHGRQ